MQKHTRTHGHQQEAKRLCGGALTIYPYHGESRKKDPDFLAKFDVVVTTYGVVHVRSYSSDCFVSVEL